MQAISRAVAVAVCLTAAVLPVRAATFTVTNTNDTGPGSLRQAMLDANASSEITNQISFAIGSGAQVIRPLSPLPSMTGYVFIDGSTQPGYAGTPLIEIDGALDGGSSSVDGGLNFGAYGGGVRALVLHSFYGAALDFGGTANVRGCYIGTDASGTQARPSGVGIVIRGGSADLSRIGGTDPIDRNLISANDIGVVLGSGARAAIDGNRFGTNVNGTALLGSPLYHIRTSVSGSPVDIGRYSLNYFSGGGSAIVFSGADDVQVINNVIGRSHAGVSFPPNIGIELWATTDAVVSGNSIDAISLGLLVYRNSVGNTIRQNEFGGTGFAIDLADTSGRVPTDNDYRDLDLGANNFLNFPDLVRVSSVGPTTVEGTYSGAPNRTITVDLYRSASCHGSGRGNGTWLASLDITTDAMGDAGFSHTLPTTIPQGQFISATATYAGDGTSEFSPCRAAEGHGTFAWTNPAVAVEEGALAIVDVRRSGGRAGEQVVTWTATGGTATAGTDATPVSGTLTFPDGIISKAVTFSFPDDASYEPAETYVVTLTNVTGGGSVGTPSVLTFTIRDNDRKPSIVVPDLTRVAEGNAGTKTITIPIALSQAVSGPVTVTYSTILTWASSNDLVPLSGTLVFAAGETQKSLDVTINGDVDFEYDETFSVKLESPDALTAFARFVIANDDAPPKVSVENASVVETDRNHEIEVALTATAAFSGYVWFSVEGESATPGVDFEPLQSYYVQFNNQKKQTIRIRILGDDETEGDETFVTTIREVPSLIEIGQKTGRVFILNDDTGVGPSDLSIPLGSSAPIVVDIGEPVSRPATISIVSADPGTVSVPATVVLPAGQSSINIEAAALKAPGHAAITVTMPPELEGDVFTVNARTYIPAKLVFDPATLSLYVGQKTTVKVTLEPAAATDLTLPLFTGSAGVVIPKSVTIPAGGSGTFTVEAKNAGSIYVRTRLPRAYGEREAMLFGIVRETPVTPAILRISPPDGPAAGGTAVEIHGANFVRDCSLRFGGAQAVAVQFATASLMTAITPAHAAGTVDVVLTCGERSFTLERGFTYTDASPTLSHVAPSTGNVAGGTHVRIAGTNLRSSCWPFFDGVPAPSASLESPAAMLAVTPPHAAGGVDILLRCTGAEVPLEDAFFYTPAQEPAASITTVTPLAAAPGEEVTVTGTRFRPTDRVAFTMPPATIVSTAPDKHVVIVPEVNAQRYSIDVMDVEGRATTTGPIFNVLEATRPRIAAIAPRTAPAGGEIELQGEGFRGGYTFSIGETPATIVSLTYTRAVIRLPNDLAPGAYDVNVINAGGALASIGPRITIAGDGLAIATISKTCATTSGGGTITIRGSGFEGALAVTFGSGMATDVAVVDATTLTATVPAGEAGLAQIRVVRGDGAAATWTNGFRYTSPFDPNGCGGSPPRGRSVRH